ncbi:hypothetical protein CHUAL_007668 [Chamberlinius hualienensis]
MQISLILVVIAGAALVFSQRRTGKNRQTVNCPQTTELNPLCGTDGTDYPNRSALRCAKRNKPDLRLRHFGSCNRRDRLTPQRIRTPKPPIQPMPVLEPTTPPPAAQPTFNVGEPPMQQPLSNANQSPMPILIPTILRPVPTEAPTELQIDVRQRPLPLPSNVQ